ncbi:hypothetical protein [Streptomyces sp. PvR034]|uniref:hypothetical protein n=1 Tax=Streptomyces sp. PvR034 TaxID=3156401 RepID=UPI003397BF36
MGNAHYGTRTFVRSDASFADRITTDGIRYLSEAYDARARDRPGGWRTPYHREGPGGDPFGDTGTPPGPAPAGEGVAAPAPATASADRGAGGTAEGS